MKNELISPRNSLNRAASAPLWNTHHPLPEARRVGLIALLNRQLVDVIDLGLQAKQAHWNVKGPQFAALHALFDEAADEAGALADLLAERAVVLGGVARGTAQDVARDTRLAAYPLEALSGSDHVWVLAAALGRLSATSRSAITQAEELDDAVTVDVLTSVAREVDTLLWKVEAHVALEPEGKAAR